MGPVLPCLAMPLHIVGSLELVGGFSPEVDDPFLWFIVTLF
jgi:hypothetical protein